MPKTILIHTLGNRDLQFLNDIPSSFSEEFLEKNKEDANFWVVKKSRKPSDKNFRQLCEAILYRIKTGETNKFISYLRFVILEQAIEYVLQKDLQIDELLILGTLQPSSHPQDTFPLAEIAQKYFKSTYSKKHNISNISIRGINASPIMPKKMIFDGLRNHLEKVAVQDYDKIYFSVNQGLPIVTQVFKMLGLFQPYQFLKIHNKKGVEIEDQSGYEEYLFESMKQKLVNEISKIKL